MRRWSGLLTVAMVVSPAVAPAVHAEPVDVHIQNFARAETDLYMGRYVATFGIGVLGHIREPVHLDEQDVIRMNRDTIYSLGVFDLSQPLSITLPDADGRFQSMQVVDQDHYVVSVEHDPGVYRFTQEAVGTRYMVAIIRTFMDPDDAKDVARANEAQDAITVRQSDAGEFDVPDWDEESLVTVRSLLLALGASAPSEAANKAFGSREEVDPVMHLIGTAAGWGGNPPYAAVYPNGFPAQNDGTVPHAFTVKDVPVDGFWSVTVYNDEGFMVKNDLGANSFNGVTARQNDDGSTTIHFGGCDDGRVNCIPIMDGWNYTIRLYQPRPEILDGSWTFPAPTPLN